MDPILQYLTSLGLPADAANRVVQGIKSPVPVVIPPPLDPAERKNREAANAAARERGSALYALQHPRGTIDYPTVPTRASEFSQALHTLNKAHGGYAPTPEEARQLNYYSKGQVQPSAYGSMKLPPDDDILDLVQRHPELLRKRSPGEDVKQQTDQASR